MTNWEVEHKRMRGEFMSRGRSGVLKLLVCFRRRYDSFFGVTFGVMGMLLRSPRVVSNFGQVFVLYC